ncbi:MAG: PIN domain-containing protein [Leptothrix sp. (in: b-proteobacteria)]
MIAVDTNVVVRLLVQDDPLQSAKARRLFDAQAGEDGSLWLSDVVLVEVSWVLARAYDRSRVEVVTALRALASHATVQLESTAAVREAIALYEHGPADFADCLLVAQAQALGCEQVATFDRKLRDLPGVKLL